MTCCSDVGAYASLTCPDYIISSKETLHHSQFWILSELLIYFCSKLPCRLAYGWKAVAYLTGVRVPTTSSGKLNVKTGPPLTSFFGFNILCSDSSLVSKKIFESKIWPIVSGLRARKSGSKKRKTTLFVTSPTNPKPTNFFIESTRIYETCCILRGFEQLSSSSAWPIMTCRTWTNHGTERVAKYVN